METWEAMKSFTANRDEATVDELWCLEHPPRVFTQGGQAGKAEHILLPGDIPVIQVDRGGQVTYHGPPGQLVIYLLIDLTRRKLGGCVTWSVLLNRRLSVPWPKAALKQHRGQMRRVSM